MGRRSRRDVLVLRSGDSLMLFPWEVKTKYRIYAGGWIEADTQLDAVGMVIRKQSEMYDRGMRDGDTPFTVIVGDSTVSLYGDEFRTKLENPTPSSEK